jgi:hypothetical protein
MSQTGNNNNNNNSNRIYLGANVTANHKNNNTTSDFFRRSVHPAISLVIIHNWDKLIMKELV